MNIAGKTLTQGDTIVGGGLIVALVALILPWYSASPTGAAAEFGDDFSVSLHATSEFWGYIFVLAFLVALVLLAMRLFAPTSMPALPAQDWLIFAVCGGVAAIAAILWLVIGIGGDNYSSADYSAGAGIGLWIGIAAGVIIAAGGYMKKNDIQPATKALNMAAMGNMGGGVAQPGAQPGAYPQQPMQQPMAQPMQQPMAPQAPQQFAPPVAPVAPQQPMVQPMQQQPPMQQPGQFPQQPPVQPGQFPQQPPVQPGFPPQQPPSGTPGGV